MQYDWQIRQAFKWHNSRPVWSLFLIVGSFWFLVSVSEATQVTKVKDADFEFNSSPVYNPIVFIPGDGGSQLEAKLNKTTRRHYLCDLVSDWYDIWLNIHLLAPVAFDCLCDNLELHYNSTSGLTENSEGVQVRPTNFGALDSVANLDIYKLPKTGYFENIIATIEKVNQMTRNVNMVGAAYDFRKAPNELDEFFFNLTLLIQNQYALNNYRPVTLICHSMGCLNSLYLLNKQPDDWKETFVKRLITLAAPWDGSFKSISAMLFGDNLGVPLLNSQKLQELQSTFPSLMYLFPKEPSFEPGRVLVESREMNFTLSNLDEMFVRANMSDQMKMWHQTRTIAANLKAPNVELWCLYGNGIDTPSKIVFEGNLMSKKYKEISGDGDGTVNLNSLRACERFRSQQEKPVYTRMFENTDHIDILRASDAAQFIASEILRHDVEERNDLDAPMR